MPDYPAPYLSPHQTVAELVAAGLAAAAGQQHQPCAVDHAVFPSSMVWVDRLVSWVLDAGQQQLLPLRWYRLCGVGHDDVFGVVLRFGLLGIVGVAVAVVELGVELRGKGLGLGLVFGPGGLAGIEWVVVEGAVVEVEEWREVAVAVAAVEDGRA